jgi:hypothetical protein
MHSHARSHSCTHTHTLTHALALSPTHALTLTSSLTLTHTHSHAHLLRSFRRNSARSCRRSSPPSSVVSHSPSLALTRCHSLSLASHSAVYIYRSPRAVRLTRRGAAASTHGAASVSIHTSIATAQMHSDNEHSEHVRREAQRNACVRGPCRCHAITSSIEAISTRVRLEYEYDVSRCCC